MLKISAGIVVEFPSRRSKLIVSEGDFGQGVVIGEPGLISGRESRSGAAR
jgi:hypothetical protein